ncbi:hypothetical protein PDESU_00356 [Pontiella desulfatans]|uniref:Uncharacterized protein n=1 Tax=Pontiella desulfatans TaxID=2750659 RepID=A0A6C2TW20_PONDE|nr:hypothetical protein [Pontiella desulfatans]VGO11809.1 hypothetical protein PDESU_00356 [Pontiella desulfatans]
MDNPYKFNWEPIYREYLPELASQFVLDYESVRDFGASRPTKQFSCVAPKYKVDSERYDNEFWEEMVIRYCNGGREFGDELSEMGKRMGYRTPWPGALEGQIYQEPVLEYHVMDGVPYVKHLLDMASDEDRRHWISLNEKDSAISISPAQIFAHRLIFEEYEAIIDNRCDTANALYQLMDYSRRCSLEEHLPDRLVMLFSSYFPDCLSKKP